MGGAAPRFLFLLTTPFPLLFRHNLRLLSPSFSSRLHRHVFHSSTCSSSHSPSLTPKLKASQHQQIHTQPSPSIGGTHPWPECSRFLSHISSAGYASTLPANGGAELWQSEANACLAFARDRPNLLRLLSMRDVAVLVEHGTPFLFTDAEDSVRKMKAFVSNAGATALDTDKANTVDLMKFMLSYACNPLVSSERNSLYNRNLVESSVRNLFGELFKLSYSAPGPNSFDSLQNQMPGRLGRTLPPGQNIEMKRGDWICPRCSFMNFAKNIKCLECEEARPKRQLTGGEWECPQCDFFNYGRNVTCIRCDCKRPGQISLGVTNTMSRMGYENGNNPNPSDVDARLAANEEKAQRWFSKVSQLENNSDITSAVSDKDFPEIMPMRKGENRFVVSKKKDRSLTTPAYKRRLAMEQSGNNNFVPFVPFPPDYFVKKDKQQEDGTDSTDGSNVESSSISEVTEMSGDAKARLEQSPKLSSEQGSNNNNHVGSTYGATSSGNSSKSLNQDHVPNLTLSSSPGSESKNQTVKTEWAGKSLEGSAVREPDPLDMSEEAKAERWFRRVAQIKDISELSQIPDEDFPSIMPMRKGVNRFVVSKRKTPLERRLTSQQYRKNLPTVSSDPIKRENEGS